MASHGYLILDTLDMIEYDPCVFQISSELYLIYQVHPGFGPQLGHLENKHLVGIQALIRELVFLNVGPMAIAFECGNAIHDPKSSNICGDIVFNA